ncbi:hypothetical protein [Amycolatopsis balhimycina]|nr:hypothetical protein [Amycolatopsis balhimycina]
MALLVGHVGQAELGEDVVEDHPVQVVELVQPSSPSITRRRAGT